MKTEIVVIVAFASYLFGSGATNAQGLTLPWDTMTPLTAEDRALIHSTVQEQIHGRNPGTAATWANPASGHSGTITLLNKSVRQNMPCEQIEYRIMEPGGGQQHGRYVFTSCRLPDGNWKLAD